MHASSVAYKTEASKTPSPDQKPNLLNRICEALRLRHYSRRTEEAYVA